MNKTHLAITVERQGEGVLISMVDQDGEHHMLGNLETPAQFIPAISNAQGFISFLLLNAVWEIFSAAVPE